MVASNTQANDVAVLFGQGGGTFAPALVLIAVFWRLRLTEAVVRADPTRPPPNPIGYIARFAAQPRLVLAWGLAVGRNCWWLMYLITD